VGNKTQPVFGGQGEKSIFYVAFLPFFAFEGQYLQFHITKKSETRRTCWHSRFTKSYQFE